jgi:hypothetical protein
MKIASIECQKDVLPMHWPGFCKASARCRWSFRPWNGYLGWPAGAGWVPSFSAKWMVTYILLGAENQRCAFVSRGFACSLGAGTCRYREFPPKFWGGGDVLERMYNHHLNLRLARPMSHHFARIIQTHSLEQTGIMQPISLDVPWSDYDILRYNFSAPPLKHGKFPGIKESKTSRVDLSVEPHAMFLHHVDEDGCIYIFTIIYARRVDILNIYIYTSLFLLLLN